MRLALCSSTVLVLMPRMSAMHLLNFPATTSSTTCRSRRVSTDSRGSGCAAGTARCHRRGRRRGRLDRRSPAPASCGLRLWQRECKHGAARFGALEVELAAVEFNNGAADGQPDSHSLWLRCEERCEELRFIG